MIKFKNIGKHFKLVCKHKYYVYKYCAKVGIRWRGLKHDISKFSPIEFFESVKYFDGSKSPIDVCKEKNGYSKAWLHHKGRNSHHYEYWVDNFDKGGQPLVMPFEDSMEMLCDYLGAGHAYMGKKFSYYAEYKWWLNNRKNNLAMHPINQDFIEVALLDLIHNGSDILTKNYLKKIYNKLINSYNRMEGEKNE